MMNFFNEYKTNVLTPIFEEGEKWLVSYDKEKKVQVEEGEEGLVFGKKVYIKLIVTNKRVLLSLPDKNIFKAFRISKIIFNNTEITSSGRFKKKYKLFVTVRDKEERVRNLNFIFSGGKKKPAKEIFDTLQKVINDEEEDEGEIGDGESEKPKIDVPWVFDLYPYNEIFSKDETTAKKEAYNASQQTIERNLITLLGPTHGWCDNNSQEVINFRNTMKNIQAINKERLKDIPFEKCPLPLYLSQEPEPKDSDKIFFLCGVHIDTCEQFSKPIFQSCQCDVNSDAETFLTTIIRKANNIRLKGTPEIEQNDWVLKVTGANEYIYGKHELFKFEAIRRSLKYGKPYIELNLLKKEVEMAKIDHQQGRLKNLEYFPEKTREDIKLEHKKLSFKSNIVNLGKLQGLSTKELDVPFKVTLRDVNFMEGCKGIQNLWIIKKKHGKDTRPEVNYDDSVIYLHAQLVYGHFLLAEGFTKAKTLMNRTSFEQEIELWAVLPDKQKRNFWPSQELCRPKRSVCQAKGISDGESKEKEELRRRTVKFDPTRVNEGERFLVKNMPRETILLLTVYARKFDEKDPMWCPYEMCEYIDSEDMKNWSETDSFEVFKPGCGEVREGDLPVGSYTLPLIRFNGEMETGRRVMRLNEQEVANLWSLGEGSSNFVMTMDLLEFSLPIYYPTEGFKLTKLDYQNLQDWEMASLYKFGKAMTGQAFLDNLVKEISKLTPMDELSARQKWMIWQRRGDLKVYPEMLFWFLRCVPYHFPVAVNEAKKCMRTWAPLKNPLDALELLDFKYADMEVRSFAVNQIETLPQHELRHYVLQLCQALKFELYHDSPLARFLLKRALADEDIGQSLFWYLKSEMHIPSIRERFGLINEEFLRNCGGFRIELLKQACVVEQLLKMSKTIVDLAKSGYKKNDLHTALRQMLTKATLPPIKFKLPLSSKVEISTPVIEKCRVMGSAKKPLFLFFKNADPFSKDLYGIMFKVGDDLRQDLLTLQMLRIMDNLWKTNGFDFHIRPYGCITTGDEEGMIEIVQRSDTIGNIMVHLGTELKKQTLPDRFLKWLEAQNPKSEWEEMKENFKKSCAGYCIASLALGLGDRHADNIMMSRNGDLFHIDFGHFLGHKKAFKMKKMGIQLNWDRETTPFVFTYQYAYVLQNMRSKRFKEFEDLCVKAFTMIRDNAKLLMVLLMLMLGCGIPELKTEKEIEWIPKILELKREMNEEEIRKKVKGLILESVKNKRQIISDIAHNMKHKVKGGMKSALSNPFALASGLNYNRYINQVL